ncbi:CDP-glucose 4,6-dehydratase [Neobacillus sp. OS1-2]|uniref:CDP-glucose 4,6-dehydratase n=1 Tax=Neobacillus sp. OS1-2 TaxID=3070680 RepID=UPI0027E053FF|nr:CDP-glucose 4,6-dehydratase [Neobacillus sp. OS1-2]WML39505.1 CDP-glucose 4,6-dehydratase [Neobacillus sp. OS1-2]
MINRSFWQGKRVFLTGHTGFKGSWLSLWLSQMGAKVTGYALAPATIPSLFEVCQVNKLVDSHIGDISDFAKLSSLLDETNPDIVIHMAAQPFVGESYNDPVGTFQTNVMGTVHLFEAIRLAVQKGSNIKAVVNVTTDKCYDNKEWVWGYRETDSLGGKDPYSASKACSELVTNSYRESFFPPSKIAEHGVAVASARAGNVIGGGDWSTERLIPQCLDSLLTNKPIFLRRPNAIRPWQHVLEPLSGYLLVAEKLYEQGELFAQPWNFGPDFDDCQPVGLVVDRVKNLWGGKLQVEKYQQPLYQESDLLMLDCAKSKSLLGWQPVWRLDRALEKIVEWHKAHEKNDNILTISIQQIEQFMIEQGSRNHSNG